MKLKELLRDVPVLELRADPETEIRGVAHDSRRVEPGFLFVAVSGFATDGNRFIPMAVERGAAVVVTATRPETELPYVLVEQDRLALALIGRNFYGRPDEQMTMVGITGTNGKTSSTLLLKQVLEKTRHAKVGLVGTMFNAIGDEILPTERTTPESLELQELFAKMRDAGCAYVIMEVSSHALALDRVAGIYYDVAAFTNLTEDHLDFHKTMESYCDAKALLFQRCRVGVLNMDSPWFRRMTRNASCRMITTSQHSTEADLLATDCRLEADCVRYRAVGRDTEAEVQVPIPGHFTVENSLTVLGMAQALGVSLPEAAQALKTVSGVKGRVEVVPTPGMPYTVLIDYAHTPDGLENVLSSVKDFCKGRLIAVFGCGGDRDPIKRPIMGKIGVKLADLAVITSDNPRTEDPMAIISDILKGLEDQDQNYVVIENRRKAIRYAMDIGQKDDIIVLAGKGHETYQEINGVKHHLDEREEVAAHLVEMKG